MLIPSLGLSFPTLSAEQVWLTLCLGQPCAWLQSDSTEIGRDFEFQFWMLKEAWTPIRGHQSSPVTAGLVWLHHGAHRRSAMMESACQHWGLLKDGPWTSSIIVRNAESQVSCQIYRIRNQGPEAYTLTSPRRGSNAGWGLRTIGLHYEIRGKLPAKNFNKCFDF